MKKSLKQIAKTWSSVEEDGSFKTIYRFPVTQEIKAVDFDLLKPRLVKAGWTKRNGNKNPHTTDTVLFKDGKWIPVEFKYKFKGNEAQVIHNKLVKKLITFVANAYLTAGVEVKSYYIVINKPELINMVRITNRIEKYFPVSVWKDNKKIKELIDSIKYTVLNYDDFNKMSFKNVVEPDKPFMDMLKRNG